MYIQLMQKILWKISYFIDILVGKDFIGGMIKRFLSQSASDYQGMKIWSLLQYNPLSRQCTRFISV